MVTNQEAWKLYEQYVDAWKVTSADKRSELLTTVLAANIQYCTPEYNGGREAVLEDMTAFQKKIPGGYFEVEDVSSHDDFALFTWVLVLPDGSRPAKGHDHIRVSPEGKIASIITFAPSVPKP